VVWLKKVNNKLQEKIKKCVEENGYELNLIQIEKVEGLDPIINIQIKNSSLEDCYKMSSLINEAIDEFNIKIREKHIIDVSTAQIEKKEVKE
jgi:ribosome maturation factor RimP